MPFDRTLIDRYAAAAPSVADALKGLTVAELHAHPVPGAWSVQQLVMHLMDSDLIASDRMKRIIAMDKPLLIGYDENAFTTRLPVDKLDAAAAAEIFRLNRLLTAVVLREQPDSAFDRIGIHNERGAITLGQMVTMYVEHLDHHMKFMRDKLAALKLRR